MTSGLIEVVYTKSAIGYSQRQKDTVHALGLHHLGDSMTHADTAPIRGMISKVEHLVTVRPVDDVVVTKATAEPTEAEE